MSEILNYKKNLENFVDLMKGTILEKLCYNQDCDPTFDKASLSFNFIYCFSVKFFTSQGIYLLHTSQTSTGFDTFWISPEESDECVGIIKSINSTIKDFTVESGFEELPFRLCIKLENCEWYFYAAEIYDTTDNTVDCKKNDEMILVFDDKKEADKFEALIN